MTQPPRLLKSTALDRLNHTPRNLFWNQDTYTWGRFDVATRYDPANIPPFLPGPPILGYQTSWVDDLPRDIDGHPYRLVPHGTYMRVSTCCAAMPGIDDGPLYCRSCYQDLDLAVDAPARLDANWNPGDGPVRITFLDHPAPEQR